MLSSVLSQARFPLPIRGIRAGRMSEIVQSERHGAVALLRLNRPEALNALSDDVLEALCAPFDAAGGVRRRCAASCSAARGGRSPPAPTSRACASSRPDEVLSGARGARWAAPARLAPPRDRRRARLVPRRRLRAGADLRHRAGGRGRALRPARDRPRTDPGSGRDAAAAAHRGPLARAGDDPRRAHADGARGAAGRHLLARGGAGGAGARGARARGSASPQRPALAVRLAREAVQLRVRDAARVRARRASAGCSRWRSRATTPARAWTPSWSAASPSGVTARERRGRTHRVEHDGAVATVTLDRPEALNALTRAVATRARARPARALGRRGRALRRADRRGARVLRRPGPARAGRAQRRRRDDPRDLHPDRRGASSGCRSR